VLDAVVVPGVGVVSGVERFRRELKLLAKYHGSEPGEGEAEGDREPLGDRLALGTGRRTHSPMARWNRRAEGSPKLTLRG